MSTEQRTERGSWYTQDEQTSLETIRRVIHDPPPTPSVAGWLYPGSTCTVFGEPDSGKSMLLAASTARIVHDGGEVLWVDYEMGEPRVIRRLLAFGLTDRQIARSVRRIHYPIGPPPDELIDNYAGITAAFFDGFTGLLGAYGGSSNSDVDIDIIYSSVLRPLAATTTSVLSLDHVTKDRENRGRWAIGSQRKIGAPDGAYVFDIINKFRPGEGGKARLKSSRDRDGVLDIIEFTLNSDLTWLLEDTTSTSTGEFRPTGLMERISVYLEAQPHGATGHQIELDVRGNNDARRKALRILIQEHYVNAEKGDKNSIIHTYQKPYREASEKANSPNSPMLASSSPKASTKSSSPSSPNPTKGLGEQADGFQPNGKPSEKPTRPNDEQPQFTYTDPDEYYANIDDIGAE